MTSMTALAELPLGRRWTQSNVGGSVVRVRSDDEGIVELGVRRCISGRLRETYPVSSHDIELFGLNDAPPQAFARALIELSDAVLRADPLCRRVVFAAPAGEADMGRAAEMAGFRPVVDVDVPGAELRLFVAEPDWVSNIDLQRVPGA
jgi:hypothetical protein